MLHVLCTNTHNFWNEEIYSTFFKLNICTSNEFDLLRSPLQIVLTAGRHLLQKDAQLKKVRRPLDSNDIGWILQKLLINLLFCRRQGIFCQIGF